MHAIATSHVSGPTVTHTTSKSNTYNDIWIGTILDNLSSFVFNLPCSSPLLSVDFCHILFHILYNNCSFPSVYVSYLKLLAHDDAIFNGGGGKHKTLLEKLNFGGRCVTNSVVHKVISNVNRLLIRSPKRKVHAKI